VVGETEYERNDYDTVRVVKDEFTIHRVGKWVLMQRRNGWYLGRRLGKF
jgi:hypothetical protein